MPIFKRAQAGVALDVAGVAVGDAFKAPAILENLPSNTKRTDEIEAAQLPGWRQGVEHLDNRTTSVYLRALVLTGARREELAGLTWANVDFQWRIAGRLAELSANRKPQCAMPDINSTRCKTGWPLMMPSPCQLSVLV